MQSVFSNGYIMRNLLGMVFILAIMLAVSVNTMATDLYVGQGQSYPTIQAAINASADGDTIIVMDADHTEAETNIAEGFTDQGLTIEGNGALSTAVHGRFVIAYGSEVYIQDMTICDGVSTDYGGGIYNAGTLTLTNCTVSGNECSYDGDHACEGGGIYNAGSLTLTNCTVSGNGADAMNCYGGGIYNAGTATLTNCTVSGNSVTTGDGGGIFNSNFNSNNSNSDLTLTNCTVSGNSCMGYGGGIYNSTYGTAMLTNTIVAINIAGTYGSDIGTDIYGPVTANYCLIGVEDTTGAIIIGGYYITADPLLADAANGDYHLQPESPCIDAGTPYGAPSDDLEGNPRDANPDMGAYEYIDPSSIQAAINASSDGDTINIEARGYDESLITVYKDLTIVGSGASSTIVHGRFVIASGSVVSIQNITICDGESTEYGGGIYNYQGQLTLTNCTVNGNSTGNTTESVSGYGGGIYNYQGQLTLTNCTVSENTVEYGNSGNGSGGGICNYQGQLTLVNCTVSGNTVYVDGTAPGLGGGINNYGTATLTNCTVSGNSVGPGYGGGINNAGGELTLTNTIVANNIAATDGPDIYGPVNANYCLIEGATDATDVTIITGENNITGQDPMLESLALNDNPYGTYTHALPGGSPAINAGTNAGAPETDQRGFARVGYVDIGAYEFQTPVGDDTQAPAVSNVLADPNPAAVGAATTLTATVDDSTAGGSNIASAQYSIDGGSWVLMTAQDGAFDEATEVVEASISAFSVAGVYTICVKGTDAADNVSAENCIFLVVHDPVDYVSGAGWINSPPGAYVSDPLLTGKARFGFLSRYQKGASIPTGHTHFRFRLADMNFRSDSYEWLIVAGAKAMYKGSGTVNNTGNYGFMLTAIDADLTPSTDVDLFRIKIWDKNNGDAIFYDNQMGAEDDADPTTAIGGGNIKIRAAKAAPPHSRFADMGAALPNTPTRFRLLANYPNPFNPETWLPYELAEDRSVTIRIYNSSGQLVRLLDLGHKPAGSYTSREKSAYWDGRNEAGESVSSGIYFYQIQAGEFSATRKMVIAK